MTAINALANPNLYKCRMQPRALLLGSSIRVIVTVARCLHKHGVEVHVASLLPEEPEIRSHAIASFQFLPAEPTAFAERLIELTQSLGIQLTYPCGDEVLELLVAGEEKIRGSVKVACPSGKILQKVLNKSITLEVAQGLGIPIPTEHRIPSLNSLLENAGDIGFPVIAKARRKDQQFAARIHYFSSRAQLEDEFRRDPSFGEHVIVQEYLPGGGVGIEILMHEGVPVVLFQHRRLTELPISGGVSVRARAENVDSKLADYAVALLRALDWQGVAMVEFREDLPSGRLALMEVNGRYWGSLPLSHIAGLEFPWYEWQLAQGESPNPPSHYRLVTMRWLAGEIERTVQIAGEVLRRRIGFGSGLKQLSSLVTGFFTPVKDGVWSWSDRTPAWTELGLVWRRALQPWCEKIVTKTLPWLKPRLLDRKTFGSNRAALLYRDLIAGQAPPNHSRPNLQGSRILVVCHGNIIRSPFVERLLQSYLPTATVCSAGLSCIPGRPTDARAIAVAREYGIDLTRHAAHPLTQQLVSEAEAILVMDYRNYAMLLARCPEAAAKIYRLTDWVTDADKTEENEIADPYHGGLGSVRECYRRLHQICQNLAGQRRPV